MEETIENELDWLIDDSDDMSQSDTKILDKGDSETKNNKKSEEIETAENADGGMSYEDTFDTDDDEEIVGLTPEERELVARNTMLNDVSDREEYDLQAKLQQANKMLATEEDNDDRERRVVFKKKLVDVEAPPLEYSSVTESSSSSSSSSSESEDETEHVTKEVKSLTIKEKNNDNNEESISTNKDDKILVERGGKFHMVSANDNKQTNENIKSDVPSTSKHLTPTPPEADAKPLTTPRTLTPTRPNSAPNNQRNIVSQSQYARPGSAATYRRNSDYDHIKSPYAMSPEMKDLMQKRMAAKAAREREEKEQQKAQELENRRNAEYAWKCWLQKKNSEAREKKTITNESNNNKETDKEKYKAEAEHAYKEWLHNKRLQRRKDRLLEQQQKIEMDEAWFIRDRKECNRAFRSWLRDKKKKTSEERTQERKLARRAKAEANRAKKVQKLLESIQNSQQYKYVEYYGYRF